MKRVSVYLLIILHLNVALIPQLNEVDVIDLKTHKQKDDINSILELISVTLGFDSTADDEDDDTEDSGLVSSSLIHLYNNNDVNESFTPRSFSLEVTKKFSSSYLLHFKSMSFDIDAPPPKS